MKANKNGSVIVLVLVIAVASGLVLTSLSRLALNEKRLNDKARLMIEAKEAAEATVESGFAQLVSRFKLRTSFPVNALSPKTGNPLTLTDDFYDLFENNNSGLTATRVKLPPKPYDPSTAWGTRDTELVGGLINPGEWRFIDSRVPGNEFDPLKDKLVFVRSVEVLGKATVESLTENYAYSSHVAQSLEVRDAPLFAHAIFYNMDMEIAPGPTMDVRGSVHVNGDAYVQAGNTLDFFKNVSSTGKIYHGPNPDIKKTRDFGTVTFNNGLGRQISMKDGSKWLDSRNTDFGTIASNRWNGNVMSYEHGIQRQNPVAIKDYVPDDPKTAASEMRNYAYQIIQPLRNANGLSLDEQEVERQKFAYKAGLVIHVEVPEVDKVVKKLKNPDFDDVSVQEQFLTSNGSGKDPTAQPITVYRYDYSKGYADIDFNNDGTPKIDPFNKIDADEHFVRIKPYTASGSTVESGLYDHREKTGMSLIEIDIAQLKAAVEGNDKKYWGNAGKAGNNPSALPENWWNGIIYIQVSTQADPGRADGVIPAEEGWAVKLVNGEEIPNPSFSFSKDLYGMTVVTNSPMYVEGNYNADGNSNTGSSTHPDDPDVRVEPPAALIADAVTLLSESWDDHDSLKKLSDRSTKSFTEVAAAILAGIVPSNKNNKGNYSGGVENFPRFLEDWGSTTLRYRGSMVALFESEIADGFWNMSNVYDPPNRDWGFNVIYGLGFYPPGTPNTRVYKRVNYRNLTAQEYSDTLNQLKTAMGI